MAQAMQLLREDGEGGRADDMLFETVAERILRGGISAWLHFLEQMNGTADDLGVPSYDVVEIGQPTKAVQDGGSNAADNPRLL
jgi:hypothetical protein